MNNINNFIGRHVRYYDEMGSELFGNIVAIEIESREDREDIYWIYIMDEDAINREKQLKAGNRQRKIDLIEKYNKEWKDLYNSIIE